MTTKKTFRSVFSWRTSDIYTCTVKYSIQQKCMRNWAQSICIAKVMKVVPPSSLSMFPVKHKWRLILTFQGDIKSTPCTHSEVLWTQIEDILCTATPHSGHYIKSLQFLQWTKHDTFRKYNLSYMAEASYLTGFLGIAHLEKKKLLSVYGIWNDL